MDEHALNYAMQKSTSDRSYIDKVMSRKDVEKVSELVRKERLTHSELNELQNMCLSVESKLLNLSDWERYVLLKYYVWIREILKIAAFIWDYRQYVEQKEREGWNMPHRCKHLMNYNERLIENISKFNVDVYLNIGRTSISLGGTGLKEMLNNKFEFNYTQPGAVSGAASGTTKPPEAK